MYKFLIISSCVIFTVRTSFSQSEERSYLNNLGTGDIFRIECNSRGCFHDKSEVYTIRKTTDSTFRYTYKASKEWNTVQRPEELLAWEKQLIEQKRHMGCTTIDTYRVYLNDELVIDKFDGGCHWQGYLQLKKILPAD